MFWANGRKVAIDGCLSSDFEGAANGKGSVMDTFESLVVCRCETCAEVALPHYTSSLDASAAVRSIGTANPGFVPDALLDSYPGDTTTAVLELCLANRWLRC